MSDQTLPRPLAAERRAHILTTLASEGAVRISQLTEALGVATVTLRRDLVDMEREGLLSRVHGGAVALASSAETPARLEATRRRSARSPCWSRRSPTTGRAFCAGWRRRGSAWATR
ncbi:hypothetical protein C1I63_02625 [Rathayibacter caricis DSM 15933]|uniref:HTH deoR-type domain-containing protein n=1 Tax=Rathayibacter caricis DSM 15933 TaxID=1328867 RepID=A0A2T4UQQ3_9MICO|nr:DeoR family transcriptional regulator [Rathayibacter caricis]PTL71847.1 hypothetical protein C1I63_02625 [Rathayibacter caricis DSM 15933]